MTLPLLHLYCSSLSTCCIMLPIALPLQTATLQLSYWEVINFTQILTLWSVWKTLDAEATSAAILCSLYCHYTAANTSVPLALLQPLLHCYRLLHPSPALPLHHILLHLTPVIMLLSLRAPIAGCDPRGWAPQGSCSLHVVLLNTTQCHPTSFLEVHEHSWHNRRQSRHPSLPLLELPLSRKLLPCLSS